MLLRIISSAGRASCRTMVKIWPCMTPMKAALTEFLSHGTDRQIAASLNAPYRRVGALKRNPNQDEQMSRGQMSGGRLGQEAADGSGRPAPTRLNHSLHTWLYGRRSAEYLPAAATHQHCIHARCPPPTPGRRPGGEGPVTSCRRPPRQLSAHRPAARQSATSRADRRQ